jgi:hypothetical protein
MDDSKPVRITRVRGSAAAVNRKFIGGFFAFAILFAGAAFYRPAIQAFAIGFPIFLLLWRLRLRAARRNEGVLDSPSRDWYRYWLTGTDFDRLTHELHIGEAQL